jgi:hypothetical protein
MRQRRNFAFSTKVYVQFYGSASGAFQAFYCLFLWSDYDCRLTVVTTLPGRLCFLLMVEIYFLPSNILKQTDSFYCHLTFIRSLDLFTNLVFRPLSRLLTNLLVNPSPTPKAICVHDSLTIATEPVMSGRYRQKVIPRNMTC